MNRYPWITRLPNWLRWAMFTPLFMIGVPTLAFVWFPHALDFMEELQP